MILTQATILAVDDDPLVLTLTKTLLEKEGYEVVTARSGAEALFILKQKAIHLILADVAMPEINGFALLRLVRTKAAWAQIPFIFLSMRNSWLDIHYAKLFEGDYYLTKPIQKRLLLSYVARCLDGAYARFDRL